MHSPPHCFSSTIIWVLLLMCSEGWYTIGVQKALKDLCLQSPTGFTGWGLKIAIDFKKCQAEITHSRLPSCASCEPEVMVWLCHCHSQPEHTWEKGCLVLKGTEPILKVWASASSSVLCPTCRNSWRHRGTEQQISPGQLLVWPHTLTCLSKVPIIQITSLQD